VSATVAEQAAPVPLLRRRWQGLPYWLILPTLGYLAVFFAWPMVKSFQLAFQDIGGNWSTASIERMYHDPEFDNALRFTLLLVVVIVPLQFVIAFVMALLVNATLKGRGLILFIFILPLAVSDLAAGLVWQQIFTDHGYLNTILQHLGVIDQPKIWIDPTHSNWLLGEVVLTEMWRSTSFIMIILVAGLQGIPKEFGEAAEVFGASFWQRTRNVVIPLLKPALQVALLFRIIFAFEVFASVVAITGRAKTTLAGESLRWQGEYLDPHVASAYALLILVLSLVAAGIAVRALRTPKERLLR
jgi:multiple sugar transport system permease protein